MEEEQLINDDDRLQAPLLPNDESNNRFYQNESSSIAGKIFFNGYCSRKRKHSFLSI